jgi:hypothetical protein
MRARHAGMHFRRVLRKWRGSSGNVTKVPNSENAWAAIKIAAGGNVPEPREDDPIHLRK